MKLVLAAACCALVCVDSLATDYSKERGLRVTSELELDLETTAFSIEVDGEPREGRGGGGSSDVRRIVRVDRFLEQEGGAPTRVRRSYEEVEGSSTFSFGDDEREIDLDSTLEGTVLELERGEDGEVRVTVVEGDPSSEAIDRQRLELFLDALLPGRDVGAGDSWSLEDEAVRRALGLDRIRAAFTVRDEGDDGGGRGRGRWGRGGTGAALFEAGDWTGRATLSASTEEHAGLECAVIELALQSRGELEERSGGGGGRAFGVAASTLVETTYEVELEGRLLVSKTERRPVLLELSGPARIESESEREGRRGHMRIHSVREGTWSQRVEVEPAE